MHDDQAIRRLCLSWLLSCLPLTLGIVCLHYLASIRNGHDLTLQVMTGLMTCALQLGCGVLILRRLLTRQQRATPHASDNNCHND